MHALLYLKIHPCAQTAIICSPAGSVLWPVLLQRPSFHSVWTLPPQLAAAFSSLCALPIPHLADFLDAAG